MPAVDPNLLCDWCSGAGFEPTEELGLIPCLQCSGSGYATAEGDLGPSRSEKTRPYRYEPGCRRLTLGAGKKAAAYTVGEFTPDAGFPGRAFQLLKADGEVYSVLVGRTGCLCDCAGTTYLSAAKANQRAFEVGEKTYPTLGCKHLDCLSRLLREGWLDLPETTAVREEPADDPFAS